jgi:hypothetical protein
MAVVLRPQLGPLRCHQMLPGVLLLVPQLRILWHLLWGLQTHLLPRLERRCW